MSGNNSVRLIVGLGNPGAEYERTWHNLGFLALDAFREAEDFRFGDWALDQKSNVLVARNILSRSAAAGLMLAKPQTMMNNSGDGVAALMRAHHLRPQDLWLVHDEMDLPLGKLRISRNASAAGHRGVQSVLDALATTAVVRFRLGIATAPPATAPVPTDQYVLQPIPDPSAEAVRQIIERATSALTLAQLTGVTEAMNQFN